MSERKKKKKIQYSKTPNVNYYKPKTPINYLNHILITQTHNNSEGRSQIQKV